MIAAASASKLREQTHVQVRKRVAVRWGLRMSMASEQAKLQQERRLQFNEQLSW